MIARQYLQFEGVGVIWTGGEVGMNEGASTEGSAVRRLILLTVLGLHAFSVAVGGVSSAHRLTTYTTRKKTSETNHQTRVCIWNMFYSDQKSQMLHQFQTNTVKPERFDFPWKLLSDKHLTSGVPRPRKKKDAEICRL